MKTSEVTAEAPRYPVFNIKDAIIRVRGVDYKELNAETHMIKFTFEGVAPQKIATDSGEIEFTGFDFQLGGKPFYPKNGLTRDGKQHFAVQKLCGLFRKLGVTLPEDVADFNQENLNGLIGKALKVSYVKGEKVPYLKNGNPVCDEETGEPKQLTDYTIGEIKGAEPRHDARG